MRGGSSHVEHLCEGASFSYGEVKYVQLAIITMAMMPGMHRMIGYDGKQKAALKIKTAIALNTSLLALLEAVLLVVVSSPSSRWWFKASRFWFLALWVGFL